SAHQGRREAVLGGHLQGHGARTGRLERPGRDDCRRSRQAAVVSREIERYGVYFADLDPTRGGEMAKTRPVVVVSHDAMNRYLHTVVVCPLTTSLHPRWRSRIAIRCAGREAEIAVDQIRT